MRAIRIRLTDTLQAKKILAVAVVADKLPALMANISFGFENPLRVRFGDEFFKNLPKDAGVYTFLDESGQPLYIGKADNLKRRLMSYQAAKPGQAADHILEMIEHAADLRLEVLLDGTAALRRESELIRSVRPRYNIALNYDVSYLYLGFKLRDKVAKPALGHSRVDFRLSHMDIHEGFTSFGCFRHRGKAKAGYSALLRLLFAAFCPRERFNLPAKICRSSPAYSFSLDLSPEALEPLEDFLAGRNTDLLRYLLDTLLAKPHLPKELYLPLQRDFETAKEFFKYGPADTLKLAKQAKSRSGKLAQEVMDTLVTTEFEASLRVVPKTELKTRAVKPQQKARPVRAARKKSAALKQVAT